MLKKLGFEVRDNDSEYKVIQYHSYNLFETAMHLKEFLRICFFDEKLIKTLQELIIEKKKGEAKTVLEYLRSRPISVKINNKQDYNNIINYLDKQNVIWSSGDNLKYWKPNNTVKFLSFYNKDKNLEKGLLYSSINGDNRETITVKELFEKFNIECKELPDFEIASDGRITKINNWMSKKQIFLLFIRLSSAINRFSQDCLIKYVNSGFVYATEEARDRASFKIEIETKLKNIAERLNNGRKIDWKNGLQEKIFIYYDYDDEELDCDFRLTFKVQGTIYCLDKNFLEVAKQEIGEDNLIKYFKE